MNFGNPQIRSNERHYGALSGSSPDWFLRLFWRSEGKYRDDVLMETEQEPEAYMYGWEIAAIFEDAGAKRITRRQTHVEVGGYPLFGVYVAASPEVHALVVRDAFLASDILLELHERGFSALIFRPIRRAQTDPPAICSI